MYRLRILAIDHVTSKSRQIGLNSHIFANCRPNDRIEINKNGWILRKNNINNISVDRKQLHKYMNLLVEK